MKQLFNHDSPVMQFLDKITDLLILNFFFLLACIPVVTAGAAKTALCYSVAHLFHEEGHPIADFWRTFRAELKQAFFLFLIAAAGDALLITVILYYLRQQGSLAFVLLVVCAIAALVFLLAQSWFFRLQARFRNTVGGTVRNSFLIALSRPLRSALLALGDLLPALLLLLFPEVLPYLLLAFVLLWFSSVESLLFRVAESVLLPLVSESETAS